MRKLGLVVMCVVASSCGGASSKPSISSSRTPVPVAAGTSTGAQTTAVIGASGGALTSGDGRLTLTIPAGALAADTTLGIEPITNTAPLGAGTAYRLTPEGTAFAVPATITVSFTSADLSGASSDALAIGYQSADGYWHAMASPTVDTTAQTVSVATVHLSDWSMLYGWQLRPPSATVAPLGTVTLALADCEPDTFPDPEGDALSGLVPNCATADPELPPLVTVNGWYVNGGAGSLGDGYVRGSGVSAIYTAPGAPPAQNPVAVSVDFNRRGNMKTLAISNIEIGGGGWSGTIGWTMTNPQTSMNTNGGSTDTRTTMESGNGTVHLTSVDLSAVVWTVDSLTAGYQYKYDDVAITVGGSPCVHTDDNEEHDSASGSWTAGSNVILSLGNLAPPGSPAGTYDVQLVMAAPDVPEDLMSMYNETLSGDCASETAAPPTNSDTQSTLAVPGVELMFTMAANPSSPDLLSGQTSLTDSQQRQYTVTWNLSHD